MAPAVAFRPPDHLLSAVDQAQGLDFDVGVEDFLDKGLDLARFSVGQADVIAVQVAALAAEVELIGRIAQPDRRRRVVLFAVHLATRGGHDIDRLVLELIGFDLGFGLGGQLENQELGLGLGLFAGQGVTIGLQRRTGVG